MNFQDLVRCIPWHQWSHFLGRKHNYDQWSSGRGHRQTYPLKQSQIHSLHPVANVSPFHSPKMNESYKLLHTIWRFLIRLYEKRCLQGYRREAIYCIYKYSSKVNNKQQNFRHSYSETATRDFSRGPHSLADMCAFALQKPFWVNRCNFLPGKFLLEEQKCFLHPCLLLALQRRLWTRDWEQPTD